MSNSTVIHNNSFEQGLDKNSSNYVPLSPLSFIERAALVYPDRTATVQGKIHRNWQETYERCRRLASALTRAGVKQGDTVAVMLPNSSEMFECHFGVPMAGAVLNTLNVRLDAELIAFTLDHGEATVLITDREFSGTIAKALHLVARPPLVIDVDDPDYLEGEFLGSKKYEEFLAEGDPEFQWQLPDDEWKAISLNYTSGTTGNPKGVVYHHRGAYLNAVSNVLSWGMGQHPVYLWTLPMFHCNGWCFPWTLAAVAGVSVSLRHVRPEPIFDLIQQEKVSHFCGAPIVLNMLNNADAATRSRIDHPIKVMTAGAAPRASRIGGMEEMGVEVTQVYGLTETYGPCVVSAWHDKWDSLPADERAALKARQGVKGPVLEDLMVADAETLVPVPSDGETIGEIFMRGNNVMKGYLKNNLATEEAFAGGWFHTGDLAVRHEDGYIEIKDRSKDIIISGGENISSIEVEDVLYRYPSVLEAAVVARSDEKWGETPCAFIELKQGSNTTEAEIIEFCQSQMARFKTPRTVVFGPLPKTSTGKIQKFVLREKARSL